MEAYTVSSVFSSNNAEIQQPEPLQDTPITEQPQHDQSHHQPETTRNEHVEEYKEHEEPMSKFIIKDETKPKSDSGKKTNIIQSLCTNDNLIILALIIILIGLYFYYGA